MRWSVLLCSAAWALTGATAATAEGPYIGVEGGLSIQQPVSYSFIGLSNFFASKYARGYDIAGKAGYDFEGIRVEGEIAYKRASTNQFGFTVDGDPFFVVTGSAARGNLNTVSAMANGYWDITQKRFRPYVGAGIGAARVNSSKVGYAGFGATGIFVDKSGVAFAFNLMAGVKARITRRISANIGYKYSDVENFRLHIFNTVAKSSLRSSSVLVGLSFSFGRSIVDTPPPPRPPAASPPDDSPPPALPVPTSFNISFAPASSALTEDANVTLDRIVAAYRNVGRASVMLMNIQAGSGLAEYDEQLAGRRAAAVRDNLIRRGVAPEGVVVQILDAPHAATPSAAPPPATFVLITFGPGSGQ